MEEFGLRVMFDEPEDERDARGVPGTVVVGEEFEARGLVFRVLCELAFEFRNIGFGQVLALA